MVRKKKVQSTSEEPPLLVNASVPPSPDFLELLRHPLLNLDLPSHFSEPVEAEHLSALWQSSPEFRAYHFERFVHAGGSGMVFKVLSKDVMTPLALKVARHKLYSGDITNPNAAQTLSPLSEHELRALKQLSHSNIVRLYDTIVDDRGVFAIVTSFVNKPAPLDHYLRETLRKDPSRKHGVHPFSPKRLEDACIFLHERFQEVVDAVSHMHDQKLFHCDLKPANILIESRPSIRGRQPASYHAILTDLGSCVHPDDADENGRIKIQFTWTYAHPKLQDMSSDPKGISGGGLKASARPLVAEGLERFDLFALGRTLQEALAELEREFGERCYASYNFRFLHVVAALLLDGHNAPIVDPVRLQDGRRFIRDAAMDYPVELFKEKKLTTAKQLSERLRRFFRSYWPSASLPELDAWGPDVINTGVDRVAPFSDRVTAVFRHPAVNRLRSELQLGWVKEVYPGATHTRWSHSLGVFATTAEYYSALLADPEVPSARILLNPRDIEHGLIAAILHDLGQIGFGHDFEAAAPQFYDHERLVRRLLDETSWGEKTLAKTIQEYWPRIDMARVLAILEYSKKDRKIKKNSDYSEYEASEEEADEPSKLLDPVDGIARDIISGPIDADKLDYLIRDSTSCRVPYANGIDLPRFLRAITVDAKQVLGVPRMALAYRAKGSAAVESLLLARYQMYGAVYWHHTFRCIQAMFTHAVSAAFSRMGKEGLPLGNQKINPDALAEFFYLRVVCGHTLSRCRDILRSKGLPLLGVFFADPVPDLVGERALEFLWKCSDAHIRALIEKLARRELFRRVFEIQVGDLGERGDYGELCRLFDVEKRIDLCNRLRQAFLDAVHTKIQQKGGTESVSESAARKRYSELSESQTPLIVVDFPMRGIAKDINFPRAIGDAERKYISGRSEVSSAGRSVFSMVRRMQIANASVRVFAERKLHELIVRYLDPLNVQQVTESVLPQLKVRK